jgi:hypothetical protein
MSIDTVFQPTGPLILVGTTPVRIMLQPEAGSYSIRVRCLAAAGSSAWFSYGPSAASLTGVTPAAPTGATVATASPNTVGMFGQTVETFEIQGTAFMVASAAGAFEVLPGRGA